MVKLATFIVDKRNLIFLLIGVMLVFSVVSRNWVKVENDLTAYLPAQSETRQGLDVMADQFTTFGSAKLMISSVTYDRAAEIADEIRSMDGVQSVTFDDSSDHYNNVSALYDITFDYPEADSACVEALNAVLERYSTYDTYLDTTSLRRSSRARSTSSWSSWRPSWSACWRSPARPGRRSRCCC